MEVLLNILEHIAHSLPYVVNAQNFWLAMGMTVSVGMLIGALLFDGRINEMRKGVTVLGSYLVLLLFLNISRIYPRLILPVPEGIQEGTALASTWSIVLVSIAYFAGMCMGVCYIHWMMKRKAK